MRSISFALLIAIVFFAGFGTVSLAVSDDRPGIFSVRKPNFVILIADDQRFEYLGCQGMPFLKTPNIDSLAREGVRFENAFATSAACTPNRTCILTGQYERKHGITFGSESSLSLEAFSKTYPMLLRGAGYYTAYVGKNHTPIGLSSEGHGYESGVMEKQFDYWYANHGHMTFYPKSRHPIYKNAKADTQVEIVMEGAMNFLKHDPSFAGAMDFLRTKPADRPFCLLLNFNVPHGAGTGTMRQRPEDPSLYKSAYRDLFDRMPLPDTYVAPTAMGTPKLPLWVYNGKQIPQYDYVKKTETLKERIIRTCQTISGIDRVVGAIVAELRRQDLYRNTVFIFTSDHGLLHGEHGLGGKVLLYDGAIRVPLVIRDPGLPADPKAKVAGELALSMDIAPTVLDLAGLPVPGEMQGRSLKPLLRGGSISWRKDFFLENMFMGQNYPRIEAVRDDKFKYIRYFDKSKDQRHILSLTASIRGEKPVYEELFDLREDQGETMNLATSAAHGKILEKYRARCRKLVIEAKGGSDYPKTHIIDPPTGFETERNTDRVENKGPNK